MTRGAADVVAGEWIPITLFVVIGAIVIAAMHYWSKREAYSGDTDYRRLAEEATRGQRALLEQIKEMNETLQEIERLLSEV